MGDWEKKIKAWADKHVKDPTHFMKMEVFSAEDPRIVEHDDLIPLDAMIMLPIAKGEDSQVCTAFGFGLGDGQDGPNVDCDLKVAVVTLLHHMKDDCDTKDCSLTLHLMSDLFELIDKRSPLMPLLISIVTGRVKLVGQDVIGAIPVPPEIVQKVKEEMNSGFLPVIPVDVPEEPEEPNNRPKPWKNPSPN